MGSFANGIQVQSANASEVASAVNEILRTWDYEATDKTPALDAAAYGDVSRRAIQVSNSHNGWVGVLDSDIMGAAELAEALSARLDTHVLQFFVNDSDAWIYVLYRGGELLDEFDSSGGASFGFDVEGEQAMAEMMQMDPSAVEEFERQAQQLQAAIEQNMPADLRAVNDKMQTGQQPTLEEAQRLAGWMQEFAAQIISDISSGSTSNPFAAEDSMDEDEMKALFGDDQLGEDDDESFDAPAHDAASHAQLLGPLLPAGEESRAEELFEQQAVFAEEVLGDFMQLLKIRPQFANLSYEYLQDWTPAELESAAIAFESHLKFERADEG